MDKLINRKEIIDRLNSKIKLNKMVLKSIKGNNDEMSERSKYILNELDESYKSLKRQIKDMSWKYDTNFKHKKK